MTNKKKYWIKLALRIVKLYFIQYEKTSELVMDGYNYCATKYDNAWTNHMREHTDDMLKNITGKINGKCVDLFCGTGYVAGELAKVDGSNVIGVDLSKGMLDVAKINFGNKCNFINMDVLDYLKSQPRDSFDLVTCAWGLAYSKPYKTIKEISRILKPGGYVAIIDNKLNSIWEMFIAAVNTVAEEPKMLKHVMKIHLLPNVKSLIFRMRLNGLKIKKNWGGEKTYYASSGKQVIDRLVRTGAASGYKHYVYKKYHNQIIKRFSDIVENLYMEKNGIPITHRFFAVIGQKK